MDHLRNIHKKLRKQTIQVLATSIENVKSDCLTGLAFTMIFICQREAMRMTGMKALPARPSFQCPATATQTPSTMAKVLWKITPRRDPDICKD